MHPPAQRQDEPARHSGFAKPAAVSTDVGAANEMASSFQLRFQFPCFALAAANADNSDSEFVSDCSLKDISGAALTVMLSLGEQTQPRSLYEFTPPICSKKALH